jgi:MATE family multidrug resistance protein
MAETEPTASAAVTHARVLRIALPIMVSNATTPILGAVDTAVVGQMGAAAPIGAVGIGAIILTSFYWLFGFLRMGTVGLASQALGANDTPEVHAILSRCLLIGFLGGLVLVLVQVPLFYAAFLVSPASAEVELLAREYMAIRIWSAPALIAMYGVTGWLVAQERTAAVLVIQLVMNSLNVVLNLWFVLGLDLGVAGVAWATFIAEWTGLALGLWMCRGVFAQPFWTARNRVFDPAQLARMARVNRDIMIRSLLLQAIFVSFLFFSGDLGDVTLAANQVLLQFVYVTAYALDGFAYAVETLVGQAFGRRDTARLRSAIRLTSLWGLAFTFVFAAAFALFGPQVIAVMTTAENVRTTAESYLIYIVLSPILGLPPFILDGVFVGATRAKDMRNMMAISAAIYAVCLASLMPIVGNHGLWAALLISFVARGVTLALKYPTLEKEAAASRA